MPPVKRLKHAGQQGAESPKYSYLERSNAVDLIISDKIGLPGTRRVVGAWIWNRNKEKVETCQAKAVVLATGGASKCISTPPTRISPPATVSPWPGVPAAAWQTWSSVSPNRLFHPQARNFLLTEALRGEGAHLKRPDGTRLCRTLTSAANWPRAISSPAPSIMR
jgi:L-aspartate oxidase